MKSNLLSTRVGGLELRNPTILASGVLGYTAESLRRVAEGGAGAVVTKSVGQASRAGYANPTVVVVSCGLVNSMGLPNPGIDKYREEISQAKAILQTPLIVSVFGYSADEYALVARKAVEAGADAVELNVSCPHVENTGLEIGQDPKLLREVVSKVKASVQKPVIVKLSPNVTDIVDIAKVAIQAGADALTAINTVKALAIDAETAFPILANVRGGLSGPAIKPIALRCVYDLYEHSKTQIIGCGGITRWQDAVEFLLAGASAIQIGTAVALEDSDVFQTINLGVETYLKKKGYESVQEVIGLAH